VNLRDLADERGYVVEKVEVPLGHGATSPGWLVFDLADQTFIPQALGWTSAEEVEAYIREASC
jgi:hypothetical protein